MMFIVSCNISYTEFSDIIDNASYCLARNGRTTFYVHFSIAQYKLAYILTNKRKHTLLPISNQNTVSWR
jgi:hypothetical protein